MDPKFTAFPDYVNGSNVEDEILFPNLRNGFNYHVPSPDLSFMDIVFDAPDPESANFTPYVSTGEVWSQERNLSSPNSDGESSDPILKYITQILLEEDIENMLWEAQDPLALRNAEQSFSQVLGEQNTPQIDQPQQFQDQNPEPILSRNGTDNLSVSDVEDHNLSLLQVPLSSKPHFQSTSNFSDPITTMGQNIFSDEESILQFKRGFEEASKFVPKIDLGSSNSAAHQKRGISNVTANEGRHEGQQTADGLRSRKNHVREDRDSEEERTTKQSAVFVEESDLTEMFDKVLLYKGMPAEVEAVKNEESKALETNGQPNTSKGGKTRSRKKENKKETICSRSLLILCAQAVASFDRRTATELLKQIREHSSTVGDSTQRLAHYFADGLEARLEGVAAGTQICYRDLVSKKTTAADILKAYKIFLMAMPYKTLAISFANLRICKMAEKAKTLHIIDFGILFGFQWPILIEHLSTREGGPPRLRITGIELPQKGFRPAEGMKETGRRLAQYCERFNVPFEYNGIALQEWETLKVEDLKIDRNEMLAVNNLYRFESLLDEMTEVECPRDAVLRVIRSMNPDIFVHSVFHGSFTAGFFVTRFKEALFYFTSIFDTLEATLSGHDPERLMFENLFYGRAATNVVACEGSERIVRPETCKQWQNRNIRAGFKPLPLDPELMDKLREKLKTQYHKDFVIDEDGPWLLQGWKGRIMFASSCWTSSQKSLD